MRRVEKVMLNAVFFDLDGTLADTAPDLATALNDLCIENGIDKIPFEKIRPVVSHGGNAIIRLAFDYPESSAEFMQLRQRFLDIYNARLHNSTNLFPGMTDVLAYLEQHHYLWGVVTNKPAWLTDPLMKKLDLSGRATCVISGDTTAHKKPHPEPLLHACRIAGCEPGQSVYLGDAERDIQAGRAAGMLTLVARYGYIENHEDPLTWNADGIVDTVTEIVPWLEQLNTEND